MPKREKHAKHESMDTDDIDPGKLRLNQLRPDKVEKSKIEDSWSLDSFKNELNITIKSLTTDSMEFDMIGLSCIFANTLRRVILAEVPTMAIEKVYLYQNTSVIPDDVFAHRIGLIPLNVDPRLFDYHSEDPLPNVDEKSEMDSKKCLFFELDVKCKKLTKDGLSIENGSIYSRSLKWVPLGDQENVLKKKPGPVDSDILLAKLVPGQEICFNALAVKGSGRDHAKFSPVATAFYRLHPRIRLLRPISGKDAEELKSCFTKGVIKINSEGNAEVANERIDMNSREVLHHETLKDSVEIALDTKHFIFTVESTGALLPNEIVEEALKILIDKCRFYLDILTVENQAQKSGDNPTSLISSHCSRAGRMTGLTLSEADHDSLSSSPERTFVFTGEDHTLGNALRFVILNSNKVNYCGYCNPHPLEDKINFRIQSKLNTKDGSAQVILEEGLRTLQAVFEHMLKTFSSATETYRK